MGVILSRTVSLGLANASAIGDVDFHLMSHLLSSPSSGYLGNNRKQ
jgi:hypothetical protein